jgi:hypothetical protein
VFRSRTSLAARETVQQVRGWKRTRCAGLIPRLRRGL